MWMVCGFKNRGGNFYINIKQTTRIWCRREGGGGGEFIYLKRTVMNADTRITGYGKKTREKMRTSDFFGMQAEVKSW